MATIPVSIDLADRTWSALRGGPVIGENAPATTNLLRSARQSNMEVFGSHLKMHNSPAVAADPNNSRFVALANRLDGPDFGCDLHVSGDGGESWVSSDAVPRLPPGADKCYAPEIAFDGSGRLYYLFVGLHTRGNKPMGAFLTSSSDRGRNFSKPNKVLSGHPFQVRMAIDQTQEGGSLLHLVWLNVEQDPPVGGLPGSLNPLLAAHSNDGGRSFSDPVQVSDPDRVRVVAPSLAIGRDGRLYVLYYDLQDDARDYHGLEGPPWEGKWHLVMSSSEDNGASFRNHQLVDDGVVPPERVMLIYTMPPPALAADEKGRLYAAWHDARNGDWDVFLRTSRDGGDWGRPLKLNDDALRNHRHQHLPRISTAPNGRVDAVFYDRRNDSGNNRADIFYTFSTDGAKRFSANQKVTSLASDTRIGPRYPLPSAKGLVEYGSRLGLFSSNVSAVAAWTDTRNANLEPQQDIFTAKIRFSFGSNFPDRWVVLSLLTIALFGGILVLKRWHPHRRVSGDVQHSP